MFPLPGAAAAKLTWEYANANGLSLDELGTLFHAYGAPVQVFHSNKSSLQQFRALAAKALRSDSGQHVAINFKAGPLGYAADIGHHGPLAAYHERTDRFLLLDVWKDWAPAWFSTEQLWGALNTTDPASGTGRGFLLVGPMPAEHKSTPPPGKPAGMEKGGLATPVVAAAAAGKAVEKPQQEQQQQQAAGVIHPPIGLTGLVVPSAASQAHTPLAFFNPRS